MQTYKIVDIIGLMQLCGDHVEVKDLLSSSPDDTVIETLLNRIAESVTLEWEFVNLYYQPVPDTGYSILKFVMRNTASTLTRMFNMLDSVIKDANKSAQTGFAIPETTELDMEKFLVQEQTEEEKTVSEPVYTDEVAGESITYSTLPETVDIPPVQQAAPVSVTPKPVVMTATGLAPEPLKRGRIPKGIAPPVPSLNKK